MTTKHIIKVLNIDWDTDGETPDLPSEMIVFPLAAGIEDPAEDLADWLSDKFGWCVNSVKFAEIEHGEYQVGLKKTLFMVEGPQPNGESTSMMVVAADPIVAQALYLESVLMNEWYERDDIPGYNFNVFHIHPLGSEYDSAGSGVIPWEQIHQTEFNAENKEPEAEATAPQEPEHF